MPESVLSLNDIVYEEEEKINFWSYCILLYTSAVWYNKRIFSGLYFADIWNDSYHLGQSQNKVISCFKSQICTILNSQFSKLFRVKEERQREKWQSKLPKFFSAWNHVTLLKSPSAKYCTLFKMRGCWMLKQRVAQKNGNVQGARVTAVPTLMYSTLLSKIM
jgi:hypothetical protein